jgi:hypothetical protein
MRRVAGASSFSAATSATRHCVRGREGDGFAAGGEGAPYHCSTPLIAADLSAAPGLANATAYDAVLRLRPGFLNPRDARTGTIASRGVLPAVFVDGVHYGGLDDLRVIAASAVAEMQYVRSFDALHRYGPGYPAGVILVRLRR